MRVLLATSVIVSVWVGPLGSPRRALQGTIAPREVQVVHRLSARRATFVPVALRMRRNARVARIVHDSVIVGLMTVYLVILGSIALTKI